MRGGENGVKADEDAVGIMQRLAEDAVQDEAPDKNCSASVTGSISLCLTTSKHRWRALTWRCDGREDG